MDVSPGTLRFFYGTMSAGKSTLALQVKFNYDAAGRKGFLLTRLDRAGSGVVSSRLGLSMEALEVFEDTNLFEILAPNLQAGGYVVVDEAQFLSRCQVEQLALLVDERGVDVECFGLSSDFTASLFEGSGALMALADVLVPLQVPVLCWCGHLGRVNARVVDGVVVHEGEQVIVGDTAESSDVPLDGSASVSYRVLCRHHWRSKKLG